MSGQRNHSCRDSVTVQHAPLISLFALSPSSHPRPFLPSVATPPGLSHRARANAGRKTGANITAIATSAAIPRVAIYVTRSRDLVAFALLHKARKGRGGRIRNRRRRRSKRGEREGEEKIARRGRASGGDALVLQIGGWLHRLAVFRRQDRGRNRQTKEKERTRRWVECGYGAVPRRRKFKSKVLDSPPKAHRLIFIHSTYISFDNEIFSYPQFKI